MGAKLELPESSNGKHEAKALTLNPASFWLDGNPAYPTIDYNHPSIRGLSAYQLSALAYACMSYRATKLTEPALWITEEVDGEEQWLEGDHPLAEILEEPNPDMDMHELLELVSLYLDGTGRALLVKTRNNGKQTAALYPFSGDEFTVEPRDGKAYGLFRVNTAKGRQEFGPDDVVFWKNADPRGLADGLAPLEVALSSINIDEDMRAAVRSMLRNKMMPGGVALFPAGQSDEDFARNKAEVQRNYAGVHNAGKLMSLEGAVDLKFLETSLKDLALGPINENAEAAICSAFKIHPAIIGALIGIKNSSGFADTIAPATDLFYDTVVIPTWTRFEKKLTKSLLREVDDNTLRYIRFDKSKVKALQDDLLARATEAEKLAGTWTLDERRQLTGKPALEDDRGTSIGTAQAPGEPPTGGKAASPRAPTVETKSEKANIRNLIWRKFDVKASRQESRYEKEAREQFEREKADIENRLSGSTDATIQAVLEKIKAAYTRKDGQYHKEWLERYEQLITETFNAAGEDIAAELGFDFSLENPRVQFAILNRTNKLAGNVTQTTYDAVKDTIAKARSEGLGLSEIAARIREDVFGGEITKTRAMTIARTETVAAMNEGEMIAAQESGVIRSKEWLSQGDAKVRDGHDIDGETVGLDDLFSNGLEYPGDKRGAAANVINCRCTVLYSDEEPTR